jgi:N-acylglucosamine-6-phosphate 2-epimerase
MSTVFDDRYAGLRGRLVVSCQAYPGEPLRDAHVMTLMARAAQRGGAAGIRAQGLDDIASIRAAVDLPLIGLWKDGEDDVFITPTLEHALAVADAGAGVVAVDGTRRPRPDGLSLAEVVAGVHEQTDALVLADCGSLADAVAAVEAGADAVATTLSGYTPERPKTEGPDLELLHDMASCLHVPVICEGRVHTPAQARAALDAGAWSVVVGTAITHPTTITTWFVEQMQSSRPLERGNA